MPGGRTLKLELCELRRMTQPQTITNMKPSTMIDILVEPTTAPEGRRDFLRKIGLASAGTAGLIGMLNASLGKIGGRPCFFGMTASGGSYSKAGLERA